MSKLLAGIAGLGLLGLAAMPVTATAAERHNGITTTPAAQSTELSSQRRHWRHRHYGYRPYYGPRRYYGPGYGYYRPYPSYGYYGSPYYYRPRPFVSFGVGPLGFVF